MSSSILVRMFWPPLLLDLLLLLLCRRRRRRRYYCCCCCCAVTRSCVRSIKHKTRNSLLRRGCASRSIAGREAAGAQQQHSSSSSSSSGGGVGGGGAAAAAASSPPESRAGCLCCVSVAERVRALSVSVHPGCPSLPWLRGFGLGIKLGACRPIVWTAEAQMNLERSSVQIVRSSGKFRAAFCKVRCSFAGIF